MNCILLQRTCKQFSLALSSTTKKKTLCSCEMIEAKTCTQEELPLFKFPPSEENLIFPLGDDGGEKKKEKQE